MRAGGQLARRIVLADKAHRNRTYPTNSVHGNCFIFKVASVISALVQLNDGVEGRVVAGHSEVVQ